MLPYLIEFHAFGQLIRVPSYGVLLALAFSLGYFLALSNAKRLGEPFKHVENLFLMVVLGAVVGSRLFHVLFEEFGYYVNHPLKVFALWEGGYTFYGGLLTAMLFMTVYSRAKKLDMIAYADIAGPSTMLGLFIGRLGCFMAGCCWGRAADVPWAVTFNHPSTFTLVRGVPLHPTQVYEALGGLILFFYLEWVLRHRKYVGQVMVHGLIGYAVLRFIVEFYRGDEYRGFVFGGNLSTSQVVSLVILPFAIAGLYYLPKRKGVTQ